MADNNWSLRDLYRTLDLPGQNPLRDLQDALDDAVRAAYGMKPTADPLAFLLDLNHQLAAAEEAGKADRRPRVAAVRQGAGGFHHDRLRAAASGELNLHVKRPTARADGSL